MSEANEATFTISIQGQGVESPSVPATGSNSVRAILEERGVALDTPVLVNGSPTTLDAVIESGDVVSASKAGKGA